MAFTLDRDQAAARLGVSSRTVDRHIQAGRIRTKRIGKKMFLHKRMIALRMLGRQSHVFVEVESRHARVIEAVFAVQADERGAQVAAATLALLGTKPNVRVLACDQTRPHRLIRRTHVFHTASR